MSDENIEISDDENYERSINYLSHLQPNYSEVSNALEHVNLNSNVDHDEQSRLFMSERSISTEGGGTIDSNTLSFLLSRQDSSDEEITETLNRSLPHPFFGQNLVHPSSPGNTSLSSRESPFLHNKVQMQFSQDKRNRPKIDSKPQLTSVPSTPNTNTLFNFEAKKNRREEFAAKKDYSNPSLRSISTTSLGKQQQAAKFMSDLKLRSIGAVEEAGVNDADSVLSAGPDRETVHAVIRRHSSDEVAPPDDNLGMTLSDSDGELGTTSERSDWELCDAADDEFTTQRPQRMRRKVDNLSRVGQLHRRPRSRDSAAAALMTTGIEWKGMHHDNLPMSHLLGEDDDEFEHEELNRRIQKSYSDGGSTSRMRRKHSNVATMSGESDETPPIFTIGSIGHNDSPRFRKPSRRRDFNETRRFNTASELSPDYRYNMHSLPSRTNPFHRNLSEREIQNPWISQSPISNEATLPSEAAGLNISPVNNDQGINATSWGQRNHHLNQDKSDCRISQSLPKFTGNPAFGGRLYRHQSEVLPSDIDHFQNSISAFSSQPTRRLASSTHSSFPMFTTDNVPPRFRMERDRLFNGGHGEDPSTCSVPMNFDRESLRVKSNSSHKDLWNRMESVEEETSHQKVNEDSPRTSNTAQKKKIRPEKVNFMANSPYEKDSIRFPTYTCPKCGTIQRCFFTAATAPTQIEGPASYLALYFSIYVISSLCIFGLQEGWKGLDCVYFAVITLTTTGLGDLVPTSDSAKIICSIFIYFGVACIGLLLGTYLAGMLDEKTFKEAMKARADSCVVCSGVKTPMKLRQARLLNVNQFNRSENVKRNHNFSTRSPDVNLYDTRVNADAEQARKRTKHQYFENHAEEINNTPFSEYQRSPRLDVLQSETSDNGDTRQRINSHQKRIHQTIASPGTARILGRQRHTRHHSFDRTRPLIPTSAGSREGNVRGMAMDYMGGPQPHNAIALHQSYADANWSMEHDEETNDDGSKSSSFDSSVVTASSDSKIKTAKYVFLTLKQALANSIVIIFIGGMGFYLIEKMSMVDSFYFTTVLLTTVGYGDIAPVTDGGKLFATVYVLLAGTVLLNNMSLISMIPLELRRRRIEQAVLTQFGDELDDAALEELATGPLIHRLNLAANSSNGLNECTREMFTLAMLVRLGKVTERDIRQTFAAFRRLDVDRDGVLNSKTIISGKIKRHRSMKDLREALFETPSREDISKRKPSLERNTALNPGTYWFGRRGSIHVKDEPKSFNLSDNKPAIPQENEDSEKSALLGHGSINGYPFTSSGTFSFQGQDDDVGLQV